jgi:hypothetical protein
MRVDFPAPVGAGQPVQATRRTRRVGSGFALPETEGADLPPAAEAAACPAAGCVLAGDVGAQADPGPTDAQAANQGRAVLDALAGLQRAALAGSGEVGEGASGAARAALAALAADLPRVADPGLDGVLRAIGQRAAVELARAELACGAGVRGGAAAGS